MNAMDKPGVVDEYDLRYCVRKGFVVKTYGILLTQLAITCGFICLSFIKPIRKEIQRNFDSPLILVFFIVFFTVTIIENYKKSDSWLLNPYINETMFKNLEDIMIDNDLLEDYVSYNDLINNIYEK